MCSIPAGRRNVLPPLGHFAWHCTRSARWQVPFSYCWSIWFFFLEFLQWPSRGDRIELLIWTSHFHYFGALSTWSRALGPDLATCAGLKKRPWLKRTCRDHSSPEYEDSMMARAGVGLWLLFAVTHVIFICCYLMPELMNAFRPPGLADWAAQHSYAIWLETWTWNQGPARWCQADWPSQCRASAKQSIQVALSMASLRVIC